MMHRGQGEIEVAEYPRVLRFREYQQYKKAAAVLAMVKDQPGQVWLLAREMRFAVKDVYAPILKRGRKKEVMANYMFATSWENERGAAFVDRMGFAESHIGIAVCLCIIPPHRALAVLCPEKT